MPVSQNIAAQVAAPALRTRRGWQRCWIARVVVLVGLPGLALVLPARALATPGTPQTPRTIYRENFLNGSGLTRLEDYVPSPDSGYTGRYTAATYWLNPRRCNGFIMSRDIPFPGVGYCNYDGSASGLAGAQRLWGILTGEAYVLGLLNTPQDPNTNRPVASLTTGAEGHEDTLNVADGPITKGLVEFQTTGDVDLGAASGRFVTLSVNAAATFCDYKLNGAGPFQPLLRFYVRTSAGTEIPVSSAPINPCAQGQKTVLNGQTYFYGSFAADGSILLSGSTGSSIGIVMRNEQISSAGNDGAFDNIEVLDVTPQLEMAFDPASVGVGGTSTLTFTITNTTDFAAKNAGRSRMPCPRV